MVLRIFPEPSKKVSEEILTRCVKAFLDLIILSMLKSLPTHENDIIAKIDRTFHVLLSQSEIGPVFSRLREDGLIESNTSENGSMKKYTLTLKGLKRYTELLQNTEQIYHFLAYFTLLEEKET